MNNEAIKTKAENMADKMNKLTQKLTANLEIAEELDVHGDELVDYIEEKSNTAETAVLNSEIELENVINLKFLADDFSFVRGVLKDSIKNTKKVLDSVVLDILDVDDEKKAATIISLAELNKSITDCSKLFIGSWKELSTVLSNIDKIKKSVKMDGPTTVNNTVNVNSTETLSTADIIKKLRGEE